MPEAAYNSYISANTGSFMTTHLSVVPLGDGTSNLRLAFNSEKKFGGKYSLQLKVGLKDYPTTVPSAFASQYNSVTSGTFTVKFEVYDSCSLSVLNSTDHAKVVETLFLNETKVLLANF